MGVTEPFLLKDPRLMVFPDSFLSHTFSSAVYKPLFMRRLEGVDTCLAETFWRSTTRKVAI